MVKIITRQLKKVFLFLLNLGFDKIMGNMAGPPIKKPIIKDEFE
jgi:hypothetical protein